MPLPAPSTVDELGLEGCLYLWALLTGQEKRLPIGQTKRMTLAVMAHLQERGIIDVPWPDARWEVKPDAKTTPIEGLQWHLTWTAYEPNRLIDALDYAFDDVMEHDDFTTAEQLRLWLVLGSAEAEQFFEQQLTRHRFNPDWAQDIGFAYRDCSSVLTIAQWRYCAWAAVRRGASLAIQQGSISDELRNVIYQEIRKRAGTVASGTWSGCSFSPKNPKPESALGRGFAERLTDLGELYWTGWPSLDVVSGRNKVAH